MPSARFSSEAKTQRSRVGAATKTLFSKVFKKSTKSSDKENIVPASFNDVSSAPKKNAPPLAELVSKVYSPAPLTTGTYTFDFFVAPPHWPIDVEVGPLGRTSPSQTWSPPPKLTLGLLTPASIRLRTHFLKPMSISIPWRPTRPRDGSLVSRSTSRPRTSLKQHTTTTTTKPTQRAARTIPEPAAWLRSSMRPALPDPATWSLAVSPDSTITIPEPTAWLGSGRQPSKKALRLPSPTSLALAAWFSSSFDATINPSSLDRSTAPCSASPPFTPSAEEQGAMELGMEVRPEEAIPTISKVPVRLSVAHFNSLQSPLERMITQFRQNSPEHDTISPLSDQRGEAVDTDVDLEGWWDQALLDCSKEGDTPLSISTVAHVVAVAVEPHLGVTSEVAGCVLEGPTFCTRSIGMEPTGANGSLERSVSRRIGPGVGGGSRRTFPARLSTFVHGAKGVFRFEAQGPV
ncbi:hypothetical protein FRB94_010186 [Tulasnella sp. JGI-2019a]|nr:hypothetical protein FRB94_010186 [Tulasnella sp. JGI-2019a]